MTLLTDSKLLLIEASLYNFKKRAYTVVQASVKLSEEYLESIEIPDDAFFANSLCISREKKKLLSLVYHKLFQMVNVHGFSADTYTISISHVYFCYQTEDEQIAFSSPHITSSLLFNPNEGANTYTLDIYLNRTMSKAKANAVNLYKRNSANVAVHDHDSTFSIARRDLSAISPADIVNSLFNYYKQTDNFITHGLLTKNKSYVKSIYESDERYDVFSISTISQFELKQFYYVTGL